MKFLDKVEPIFNIDNEMELLINIIDKKLNEIEIMINHEIGGVLNDRF